MAGNQDLENSDIKVALLILFNSQEVIDLLFSYYPSCHNHQFSCIIAQTIALSKCYVNKQRLNPVPLKNSVIHYLKQIEENFECNGFINPIEIILAILVNFHCFDVSGSCYDDEKIFLMSCQKKCILHKIFYLKIEEYFACKCGRKWINNLNDKIGQNFKIESIFMQVDEDLSRTIGFLPKYKFRDPQVAGNSSGFYKKISKFLETQLERVVLDVCQNMNCGYSEVSASFKVQDAPKVYIIDITYHAGDVGHLGSFLMTISIEGKIRLKDIYKQGQSEDYGLDGVVFFGKSYYYAKFHGKFWEFPGLHPEAGWYELLQEVLVMKLHPVSLIFKKGAENSIPELNNYKLLKFEQSAVQCDFFIERFKCSFIPEDNLSSGYFAEKKVVVDEQEVKIQETNQSFALEIPLNEWVCQCGQRNLDDFDVCTKCEELKPGVSGWLCKNCHCKNDDFSHVCSACFEINRDFKTKRVKNQEYSEANCETVKKIEENANKDWICECKCQNTKDFDVCQECSKIKPGVEGWVCVVCKGKNEVNEYKCSICDTFKSGNFKPDQAFWLCEKCRSAISAKYDYCYNCLFSEPLGNYTKTEPEVKYQLCTSCNKKSPLSGLNCYWCQELFNKPLELEESSEKISVWECTYCSFVNNSNYYNCENCQRKRVNFEVKETKKECPDCRRLISPSMEKCEFCNLSKSYIAPSFSEVDDLWECKKCSEFNESWKSCCRNCSTEKDSQTKSSHFGWSFGSAEWICNNCSKINASKVEICIYCSTRKVEQQEFHSSMKQTCLNCKKEIDEVLCKICQKLANVNYKRCEICNSDVTNIKICYECFISSEE